jgi:2-keto-4-pentenoate hydratase
MSSLAHALGQAFTSGSGIARWDGEFPGSQEAAERVRDEAAKSIGPIRAWKLGATMAAGRRDLGLSRPFFGMLASAFVFEDGAELSGFQTRLRGVESEYGFELARDLAPQDAEGDDEAFAALFCGVRPAIEIPGARFAALGQYGGLGLVADLGAAGGLVLGPLRPLPRLCELDTAPVRLSFGGRQVAAGAGAAIDEGVMGPLRGFLRQALKAGYLLRQGQTIVTGSCTGYVRAPPNERITATFDALGASVSATFVDSL